MPSDDPYELTVSVVAATDKAILVRPDDAPDLEVWIPKSQIDEADFAHRRGARGTLVIPEWLAAEKDLA
jgi:hypothetical protein